MNTPHPFRNPAMANSNKHHATESYPRSPTDDEMRAVFSMCRQNRWNSVLDCIRSNRLIPVTPMTMDNHIATTILHQAITSKGDTKVRTRVIREIIDMAPEAAAIKNGYGSLPLHVISQRNTKIDASSKELLIIKLVNAYKGAITEQGGVGKRTPLHIIFTDYVSPRVTEIMVQLGSKACYMKDKKGFLPAHVACSRHCSPEKLHMLLKVNPSALTEPTKSGETLISLAIKSATRSHPNYALIDDLKHRLESVGPSMEEHRLLRAEEARRIEKLETVDGRRRRHRVIPMPESEPHSFQHGTPHTVHLAPSVVTPLKKIPRKRKHDNEVNDDNMEDPATLLLNFSRNPQQVQEEEEQHNRFNGKKIKMMASV